MSRFQAVTGNIHAARLNMINSGRNEAAKAFDDAEYLVRTFDDLTADHETAAQ